MEKNHPQLQRRNFLKSGLALGAATLMAPAVTLANPTHSQDQEEAFRISVGPYLQTTFGNEMSILWITSKNAASWVEYGESADALNLKAYGESKLGLRPEGRLNCVTLKNLKPGVTYHYKIVSKEVVDFQPYKLTYGATISDTGSFVNTDSTKEHISFLMLNDIHDRPKSIPFLLDLDKEKQNDFIFFNGDIFDYQTDEKQIIDHMLQPCVDAFAKQTPFIYVRGNHETRGKFCREFPAYFQNVGRAAFTLGPVRFVILDTGEDKEDAHPVYAGIVDFDQYRIEQAKWLASEIESKAFKKATFRVVMMHIPPRYSGDAHGPVHCTEVFEPLLNKGKVDLVLSGHTHKYMVHQPAQGKNNYPLIIGGGPKEGTRTYTKIKANKQLLSAVMFDDSGKEVGRVDVKR